MLTGYSYGEFYDWDLYFENLYLSHFGIHKYCIRNLKEFLNEQFLNGFVPRSLGTNPGRLYQHFKPFLAQVAHLGSVQKGDYSWLLERGDRGVRRLLKDVSWYEQLKLYLDHWFYFMDYDRNGLPVWMDADHSGMDNQYRRLGVLRESRVEGADLASYLYRDLKAMEQIALRLGKKEDAEDYSRRALDLKQKVNAILWDDGEGFYFDRDEHTGERVRVKTVAGFMPLWAGIASPGQASRLVKEHLLNPGEFCSPWPVASMAASEPGFSPGDHRDYGCNWLGTVWIPVNYVLMHGLQHYGFEEEARELALSTFRLVFEQNEVTREYYDSQSGEGLGLDPFWGWSALAYLMPLELVSSYDPTRLDSPGIRMLAREMLNVEFRE